MPLTRRNFLVLTAGTAGACLVPQATGLLAAQDKTQGDNMPARLSSASIIHFSPTGTCEKIARHLGKKLAVQSTEYDLTAQKLEKHSIDRRYLSVVAVPVYYGRVPARAVEALRLLSGNGAPCVSIAVYGNRAFEDALLELNEILIAQGFMVISSGAFIGQHSITEEIGAGRPDAKDLALLDKFGEAVLAEVASGKLTGAPRVPGGVPYKEIPPPNGLTPVVAGNCTDCGLCAKKCPLTAIPAKNYRTTDSSKCILCMRCVRICPVGARALPQAAREKLSAHMAQFKERREPETFL